MYSSGSGMSGSSMYSSSTQGIEFELEQEDDDFEEDEADDDNEFELEDHDDDYVEVGMQWEFISFNRTLFYDPILALR
jgi:hypothetical protein